jgi:peptidoglycan/xylan/chitin deacetylase (PgdA/CDA1 family)
VAFTFDDGPDKVITPLLLDLLEEQGIKAAFFVIGSKIEKNRDLIRRMDKEGHIIGGHSFTHHFFFDLFQVKEMRKELKQTAVSIEAITGRRIKWFRPPYGVTNPAVARSVRMPVYHVIGWRLKSLDSVIHDGNRLLKRLRNKIKPGDVILFHDTKPVLLVTLPKFIAFLKEEHYQIVRPDQLLNIEAYD